MAITESRLKVAFSTTVEVQARLQGKITVIKMTKGFLGSFSRSVQNY